MDFKLIARQQAGKYMPGAIITDPVEIEKILSGHLVKRFNKAPLLDHEIPHVEAETASPAVVAGDENAA